MAANNINLGNHECPQMSNHHKGGGAWTEDGTSRTLITAATMEMNGPNKSNSSSSSNHDHSNNKNNNNNNHHQHPQQQLHQNHLNNNIDEQKHPQLTTTTSPTADTATAPPTHRPRSESVALMKLKTYLLALRPWSLSASLVPTLLGSALAYRSPGVYDFNLLTFLLTIFTVITVHCAGNVVNTYFDFVKGIDNRKSDDRTLVDHILTKDEVVSLGALLYMAGCVGFICLAVLSPARMEHLALVYFGGLSSSFLYTGGIGLKYIALGDVLIMIIFGPISVVFAYMSQTGHVEWMCIYYAVPLALNTEAILHSNNTRDSEADRRVGIVTLAIIIGRTASHVLYALLLFTPYTMFVVMAVKYSVWFLLPLVTLPQAFKIEKEFRNETTLRHVPRQTAKLNFFFGLLFVFAIFFTPHLPFITRRMIIH